MHYREDEIFCPCCNYDFPTEEFQKKIAFAHQGTKIFHKEVIVDCDACGCDLLVYIEYWDKRLLFHFRTYIQNPTCLPENQYDRFEMMDLQDER